MALLKALFVAIATTWFCALQGALNPVWTWDGFYAGVNLGIVRSYDRINLTPRGLWATQPVVIQDFIDGNGDTNLSTWNVIAGGQVGYNYQFCGWVFGIEADANYVNLEQRRQTWQIQAPLGITFAFHDKIQHDWLVTVRPRIGWVICTKYLPYITGGFAAGNVKTTSNIYGAITNYSSIVSAKHNLKGWTIGFGAEYAFKPHLTFKAEYLYVNLGSFSTSSTPTPAFAGFFEDRVYHIREDVARVGLNYKL